MTTPMFGCVVPGRLPLFEAQQVSENQLVYTLSQCKSINHVVIFLTGSQPLPEGFAAAIYLCWPKPQPAWYLLGALANEKPSVIFKIAKPKEGSLQNMSSAWQTNIQEDSAQIGIAIEPAAELSQKTPVQNSEASRLSSFAEFSEKMIQNVFNYCSSFAQSQQQMTSQPSETFVPMSALKRWYETFQRKMSLDPNYWKSL